MNGPQITVVGNIGGSPKLRSLADGTFVADFRVAMTPSRFDKTSQTWVDQETMWFRVTCWRALAEHAAMSFHTGDKVIVTGTFTTRAWKDKDDQPRVSLEIDATSVGMDVTRGPVQQKRFERTAPADEQVSGAEWDAAVVVDPQTGEIPEQPAGEQVAA